jgi:uncharacterized OB-fold protein
MPEHDTGEVYSETVVHAPPQQYVNDAPYQIAIVTFPNGVRRTVRILAGNAAEQVQIGDRVTFVEERSGVAYYRKAFSDV